MSWIAACVRAVAESGLPTLDDLDRHRRADARLPEGWCWRIDQREPTGEWTNLGFAMGHASAEELAAEILSGDGIVLRIRMSER